MRIARTSTRVCHSAGPGQDKGTAVIRPMPMPAGSPAADVEVSSRKSRRNRGRRRAVLIIVIGVHSGNEVKPYSNVTV